MPYGDPAPDDPDVLVGVALPDSGPEAVREMAYTFAEEFAALGFSAERLLGLFSRPFYAGPHRAYRILGEVEIRRIVAECVEAFGARRIRVEEPPEEATPCRK
jgi:hypothetical protein